MKHYDEKHPKPEFVIGLAGAVGTDLNEVSASLAQELSSYRYQSVIIKVSDLLKKWCSDEIESIISEAKGGDRINYLMNAGDLIREKSANGAALVPLIAATIRLNRQDFLKSEGFAEDSDKLELYNHCYIINSIKHPEEVRLLRRIYGDKFVMISVNLAQEVRKRNLCANFARDHKSTDEITHSEYADYLILKDQRRRDTDIGQNLSGAFHLADFFVRDNDYRDGDIRRLFEVVFNHPNVTPTKNEFAMFEANSNALRSSDLSRQVGAVITNNKLEILSRGCNEVPVPGGDTYWPEDESGADDNRDYQKGKDYNAVKKVDILKELMVFLESTGIVSFRRGESAEDLVKNLVQGTNKGNFKDLRISNLIEFGRMVHAEMFALMEAARRGISVADGVLYCTTFPCHMCTRHIIAAGIREVVYIEPYPKSMAGELYKDEISIDVDPYVVREARLGPARQVYFQPFHGVAPRRYSSAFIMPTRKDADGYIVSWDKLTAVPKWIKKSKEHLDLELGLLKLGGSIDKIEDKQAVMERK